MLWYLSRLDVRKCGKRNKKRPSYQDDVPADMAAWGEYHSRKTVFRDDVLVPEETVL